MTLPKTITLDGPAGVGKTTVGLAVARALGYLFVDTGVFYRAVTLAVVRAKDLKAPTETIIALTRALRLDVQQEREGEYTVVMNDENITKAIRDKAVNRNVSWVSAISEVRDVLNERYRELTVLHERVIMAGRDIGTVVLPNADLKIYLDGSLRVRAERRFKQEHEQGKTADVEEIMRALEDRDALDSQRAIAPLRPATDAQQIDTDPLDEAAVVAQILELVREWRPGTPPREN